MEQLFKQIEVLWLSHGIPIRVYHNGNPVFSKCLQSQFSVDLNALNEDMEKLLESITKITPYTSKYGEHYFSIKHDPYVIVFGPTLSFQYNEKMILSFLDKKTLSYSLIHQFKQYFNSLPIRNSYQLRLVIPLVNLILNGDFIELEDLFPHNFNYENEQSYIQSHSTTHHSAEKSILLFEAIKQGEKDKILDILTIPDDGSLGILSQQSSLRSYKNLFITSVTEAALAAISGGVDSETAFTISDLCILKAESLDNNDQLTNLYVEMNLKFCQAVLTTKKITYSRPVYTCIDYIHRNYYTNITVTDLAKRVSLSESHLLTLFKKDLKMSIKDYIMSTRVKESKKMLNYTNHSLADVATKSGFNDQSYFTKVFKKWTTMTPKQYRQSIGTSILAADLVPKK